MLTSPLLHKNELNPLGEFLPGCLSVRTMVGPWPNCTTRATALAFCCRPPDQAGAGGGKIWRVRPLRPTPWQSCGEEHWRDSHARGFTCPVQQANATQVLFPATVSVLGGNIEQNPLQHLHPHASQLLALASSSLPLDYHTPLSGLLLNRNAALERLEYFCLRQPDQRGQSLQPAAVSLQPWPTWRAVAFSSERACA